MQIRFKLVWNKATHRDRRARHLTGLARVIEDETAQGHYKTIWLDARALAKIAALLAVVLWFGTAGALWYWLDRDPHNRVGYADLAFPWRWSKINARRGEGYTAAGLEALKRGRVSEGLFAIRQGLSRRPDDATTRLELAKLYARSGYYAGVRDTMVPQLKLTPPPHDFIRFLVGIAAQNDDHATMLAACESALAARGPTAEDRGWLLEQKASALISLDKPAAALAALDAAGRDRSLDWRRLRMNALFADGRAAEAVREIHTWPERGVPVEFRLQMLANACRRAGQLEEMAAALKELKHLHPAEPDPWIDTITHYARVGWRDAAWSELEDCLRRFDADASVVGRIENICVGVGAPDLVGLCVENARQLGRPLFFPLFDLAVTQLGTGDTAAAARTYERLLAEDVKARGRIPASSFAKKPAGPPAARAGGSLVGTVTGTAQVAPSLPPSLRDYLRTLLDGLGQPLTDRAEAHGGVLLQGQFRLEAWVRSAEVLARAERWPAVAAVTRTGLTRFPGSTKLTKLGQTAAEKIAALPPPAPPVARVVKAAPTAKPAAPEETVPATPSRPNYGAMAQADFFAKLDEAVRVGAWAQAGELIRGVKAAEPAWLARVEADVVWREVRVAFEQDDRPQLLFLIGQRIRTKKSEVSRALEFARWYRDKGEVETARLVVGKILQEVPGYVAGREFIAELDKPAEPKAGPAPKPE